MTIPDQRRPPRILIVEDEPDMLLGLKHNLEFEGFEVVTAATGTEGLLSWRRMRPQLVLLDVMLPEKDGFTVLTEMRKEDPETPVLLLTAKSLEADKVYGLNLGCGRLHHQAVFDRRGPGPRSRSAAPDQNRRAPVGAPRLR